MRERSTQGAGDQVRVPGETSPHYSYSNSPDFRTRPVVFAPELKSGDEPPEDIAYEDPPPAPSWDQSGPVRIHGVHRRRERNPRKGYAPDLADLRTVWMSANHLVEHDRGHEYHECSLEFDYEEVPARLLDYCYGSLERGRQPLDPGTSLRVELLRYGTSQRLRWRLLLWRSTSQDGRPQPDVVRVEWFLTRSPAFGHQRERQRRYIAGMWEGEVFLRLDRALVECEIAPGAGCPSDLVPLLGLWVRARVPAPSAPRSHRHPTPSPSRYADDWGLMRNQDDGGWES